MPTADLSWTEPVQNYWHNWYPLTLQQMCKSLRAGGGDWKCQLIHGNTIGHCQGVNLPVWNLPRQQLPQQNPKTEEAARVKESNNARDGLKGIWIHQKHCVLLNQSYPLFLWVNFCFWSSNEKGKKKQNATKTSSFLTPCWPTSKHHCFWRTETTW